MLPVADYALALSMGIGIGWTMDKASASEKLKSRKPESPPKCVGSQQNNISMPCESKFFIFSAVFFDITISVKLFVQAILPCPNNVRLN